jgi:hypothetical protein
MSQEESAAIVPQDEVPQVSQYLVREAGAELTEKLKDYAETCWEMQELEAKLAEARKKRADMLKENPWLGNVQGILNKESLKMAKKASHPVEEAAPEESQMDLDSGILEQKREIPLIPKKSKPAPRPIRNDKTPEAVRARILKKSNKIEERIRSAGGQFDPDHPSHQE